MTNDHNLFHAKLQNANQQTAHHAAIRVHNDAAGILDDLGITIFDAQRRRKKL